MRNLFITLTVSLLNGVQAECVGLEAHTLGLEWGRSGAIVLSHLTVLVDIILAPILFLKRLTRLTQPYEP